MKEVPMQTIAELKQRVAELRRGVVPYELNEWLDTLDDGRLVTEYLERLSLDRRKEALTQQGALGDRLRRVWKDYLEWYEKNRDYFFKREEARRKRRIRYLLSRGAQLADLLPILEERNPYER